MIKARTKYLIKFEADLTQLSKNELDTLELLTRAAELVAELYKLQENQKLPGANFYPPHATKEEITRAAKKDPEILSSFTVVERKAGKLIAVPYHEKYAELLKPIADKLLEAAKKTTDKVLASNLKMQAKALTEGKYDEATINRFKGKRTKIDIGIGPLEKHDDQLFFIKASYEAWIGVLDKEKTDVVSHYRDTVLSGRRQIIKGERIDNQQVEASVEHPIIFSGQLAKTAFVGFNFPASLDIIEKYGSEIIIFKEANDLRLEEQILPTYNRIFSKEFRKTFTPEDIRKGNWRYVAMHEMAHAYLRYKNSPKNLQDLFPTIEELAANALGFRIAGSLLLKDVVTIKELEAMIVAFLCKSNFLKKNIEMHKDLLNYMVGGKVFVNFLLKSGAIRNLDEITVPNFAKIFVAIQELSIVLEKLLSKGSRKDAELFIKKYSNL